MPRFIPSRIPGTWGSFKIEFVFISIIIFRANIPGKPREMLNYLGGVPKYTETLNYILDNNFEGFNLVK